MKLCLDTNTYSAMRRGHSGVAELIRRSDQVLLSAVVVGELMYGFRQGSKHRHNVAELRVFVADRYVQWLPVTLDTATMRPRVFFR